MIADERLIAALRELMGNRKFLQGNGLLKRLAEKTAADPVDVKLGLGRLARQDIVTGVSHHGEPFGRVSLNLPVCPREEPASLMRWRRALRAGGLAEQEVEALCPCHEHLNDFPESDSERLVDGLSRLRADQAAVKGTPRFILSARYLLGSSKLLNYLPAAALRAFGIDIDAIPDAPPYVLTAGPANPEGVLLIENPHSFEEAVASGCAKKMALVATFGYGLSRSGDAFGKSLVASVMDADVLVPLIRYGNPPTPAVLLKHPRIFFWGDLDREGLRIFASLKRRLPNLRLSRLYVPMVEAMQRGDCHPYVKATAKDKQGMVAANCEGSMELAPHCVGRAVDQEIVSRSDIAALAYYSLQEKE